MERGWNPNVEISPNCPRCGSCNTKFCYYNNYSLTQPRYLCKDCRRYWTKGGSLRNVPVGGGCRSRRRDKSFRSLSDRHDPSRVFPYGNYNRLVIDSTSSSSHRHISRNDHFTLGRPSKPDNIGLAGNIDIAQVYANFLNHQPERESHVEMTGWPPSVGDYPTLISQQFASVSNMHMEFSCTDHNNLIPFENSLVEYPYNTPSYGLPPILPGDEAVLLPSNMEWGPNHILNAPQILLKGAVGIEQGAQNSDHFIGNNYKNSFYRSASGHGTLSRPW